MFLCIVHFFFFSFFFYYIVFNKCDVRLLAGRLYINNYGYILFQYCRLFLLKYLTTSFNIYTKIVSTKLNRKNAINKPKNCMQKIKANRIIFDANSFTVSSYTCAIDLISHILHYFYNGFKFDINFILPPPQQACDLKFWPKNKLPTFQYLFLFEILL